MLLNGRGELATEHELRIETFDLGIEVIRRDTDHLVVGTKCLKGGRDYLSIGPRLVGEQYSHIEHRARLLKDEMLCQDAMRRPHQVLTPLVSFDR
jgi:hypothetical protein